MNHAPLMLQPRSYQTPLHIPYALAEAGITASVCVCARESAPTARATLAWLWCHVSPACLGYRCLVSREGFVELLITAAFGPKKF